MSALPCRPRTLWLAVLLIIGLFVLSLLVDSPVTAAAPSVAAGAVVIGIAWLIVRSDGVERPVAVATVGALVIGGLGAIYEGVVELAVLPATPGGVVAVTDAILLAGLGLFLYDRVYDSAQ